MVSDPQAQDSFSDQEIERALRFHLPEDDELTWRPIGTGKFNTSFFIRHGSREYVLRVAPPRNAVFLFYEREMMRQEAGIHSLLRERTSVPVPEVLAFDDTLRLLTRDFILMERLPGTPLSSAVGVDVSGVLRSVGEKLAETHSITAEAHGYLGEHRPMQPQNTWVEAFKIMWRKLVEDVAAVGYYSHREVKGLLALLDTHLDLFDRPLKASLLHMDVWAENILVGDDGRLTGLIDWDRALWGDPEIEFAVLDYCGISEAPFWNGYGKKRDLSPEARIRQVFYLLYELQKYIVIRHGRNHDPARARWHKEQVMQIIHHSLHNGEP